SIVNPKFPASVGGRMATGHYLPIVVFGALSQIIPDQLIAACGSPLWSIIQTGVRPDGRTYASVLFFNGGMGATVAGDGQSTYAWPSNVSNVPIELIERESALVVLKKELRPGSGGAGLHRGGLGQDVLLQVKSETPIGLIFMAERCRFPAPGIDGGGEGARGEVLIDGQAVDHRKNVVLSNGQQILLRTPGGGGSGSPGARSAEAIAHDRRLGYVVD
ncbi:MAG: hydantoinase B/oxoprolinase family protein, partial [Hyphomicrobiaceae bacterium]